MTTFTRQLHAIVAAAALALASTMAVADDDDGPGAVRPAVLETLLRTDGAQAVVAAVLVVDEAGVLPFSLVELLGDRDAEVILLAPSNAAFEKLLGLDEGFLTGLDVETIKGALPGIIGPLGLGAGDVAAILLKHAALPRVANRLTASESSLLARGGLEVADGDVLPIGIGATGVRVNDEATIIKADLLARNGIVHFIDTVIVDDLL